MGEEGFEAPRFPKQETASRQTGGAESGALSTDSGPGPGEPEKLGATAAGPRAVPLDPDLARVVAAWATLPQALRAGIVAMVGAGGCGG